MQHRHVYERLKPVIEIVRRIAGHAQRQRADAVHAVDKLAYLLDLLTGGKYTRAEYAGAALAPDAGGNKKRRSLLTVSAGAIARHG